mgnify:CR=1 FL=1
MNAFFQNKIKLKLENRRNELEVRISHLDADKRRVSGAIPQDFSEQAIAITNDEVIDGLDELERNELKKINSALVRIEHGTFGTCAACGDEIESERLNAIPYASICINCASIDLD